MATAGQDFGEYRQWLEAAGVDTSLVQEVAGKFTASFFCSTDAENNQIASFYTGAMANAGELSFRDVAGLRAWRSSRRTIPAAMVQYAEECRTLGIPFIFDPGQQCARMSGDELQDGITRRRDRDLQRLRVRADPAEDRPGRGRRCSQQAGALIVTRGEHGSPILTSSTSASTCRPSRRTGSSIRPASATRSAAA